MQAEELKNLVNEILHIKTEKQDVELKAADQMKWVGLMNNYRHCAEEIIFKELIYV